MKIKKIIDLCKRAGVVLLCEAQEAQWISDGAGDGKKWYSCE